MPEMAIELRNVKFTYPRASGPTIAIESLQIHKGERVFIYGPSGSGKTTLLEILSGVLVPQQGEVTLGTVNLAPLKPAERDQFRADQLSFIFQNFNLLPYLTVQENIELPVRLRRGASVLAAERLRDLPVLADRLGIQGILEKPVTELSVGQQQRVAVARALIGRPQFLLADEPTSSLDYDNREKFLQVLFELAKEVGTTVLFVSHDRSLEPLFDRAVSMINLNQADNGKKSP